MSRFQHLSYPLGGAYYDKISHIWLRLYRSGQYHVTLYLNGEAVMLQKYNILRSPKGHCTPRNCTAELKLGANNF
ncbi:hypothetical protein HUN01_07355 [Nostoc edaphicum CCNP1411]|uniref:Uncharacterized protein n=1 Tax=Nostoc edaphicum CCNP1411 TaxID=1472755 RepID=A0A7D7QI64_9NOSO|nr:hypothetical protein [Nostoc edaphicum]QMS87401.1 hypothetical protein HUN01_07355 [Nostoc edaphicum CCNP1411]